MLLELVGFLTDLGGEAYFVQTKLSKAQETRHRNLRLLNAAAVETAATKRGFPYFAILWAIYYVNRGRYAMHSETFKAPKVTGTVIYSGIPILLGGLHGRMGDFPLGPASMHSFLNRDTPIYFFLCPQWSFSDPSYLAINAKSLVERMRRFPQHRYTVLLNDPIDQLTLAREAPDIVSYVWNTNCTADEKYFSFNSGTGACMYDAVYTARYSSYKRLHLAREIDNLCLITRAVTDGQADSLRQMLPNAFIPNFDGSRSFRVLKATEVSEYLGRSGCGVMLSRLEGQTRAIMEYLMVGLPVVTTPNFGGRDRFLTPSNSIFVAAEAHAVAAGVRFVSRAGFDRASIRTEALRGMQMEKQRLVDIVNDVITSNGEMAVTLEALYLPHKTSSVVNRLDHFFHELGWVMPKSEEFVSDH